MLRNHKLSRDCIIRRFKYYETTFQTRLQRTQKGPDVANQS